MLIRLVCLSHSADNCSTIFSIAVATFSASQWLHLCWVEIWVPVDAPLSPSGPRLPQTRSFRPKFWDVPPRVLGRSAPTPHIQWRRQSGASQGTFLGYKVLIGALTTIGYCLLPWIVWCWLVQSLLLILVIGPRALSGPPTSVLILSLLYCPNGMRPVRNYSGPVMTQQWNCSGAAIAHILCLRLRYTVV